ncbi:protein VASCULAR ASSOCIATED DEATH 1, chloroplastic-like isoform X3 [Durio zibethinus]|uniref:Protein VASCULAR ASSOCIATED DEATH 1, chloroplastic-like isoform X2 n=1 Tax=Durio zibethinus TaxID=66656 RepID=A0A6P5ZWN4_DURZI|nr:protein VASCULAR ASSOCIATED DEATH 1, chloroplastic-like isoform X2 [Durio zibethinus]XP_022756916.1 protein VASCULAR ASSOCIATED DEATH 1, chloroplastic-like isoform X3 [Durio zibethinus]
MAVASAAAERIDLPRPLMDLSLPKLATDVVSDSLISPNDSSPTDTPACNDPSNSSPNPSYRDVEIQSPAALRSEEYRQLFRLPPEEFLVQDFNCAFQESIFLQGHMYLFVHYICFYSNIFGFETKKIITFNEITSVKKAKTAGIFPNAIEIFAGGRKYFFASFLSRDEAFKLINDGWMHHGNRAKEIAEQESMSESSSRENGFVAIEKVNSIKNPTNDMESTDRDEDVPTASGSNILSTSDNDAEVGPESVTNTGSSTSADTCSWKPENCDAPKVPECFTKVVESKFPIKVEEFFNLYFSDNAVNFIESFHRRCGDKEFRCSSWCPHDKFGHVRDVSFQHPIKIYFGAKFGSCREAQKFRIYRNSHLVMEISQEINDVPYGDYFHVEGLWDVERDSDGPQEGCILRVYVNVAFSKRTVWKGKIVQSTLEECREAYATWIDMAHELLKQNIDKQGGVDPSGSLTETGEHQVKREVATKEPSEISHNLSDPARTLQMSDSMDVNQRIGNLLQGSLSNASSIASLLREFVLKSYSYLKSQGHISLVLAVAFAVIFLMQVSMIVLLNRPQHVHVSYPVGYMGSMGGGGGERPAEAVAWLEKRMHYLKEEMVMVEARLERMWHEHAALKAQLKELGYPEKHR